ncbi:MAG TPA: flippase-like domain-containing protein [Candidatus Cloacimonetes bacterium]|nr:flippase-like domain-containing protein [Candidatus Cloacimonadota bacterium]
MTKKQALFLILGLILGILLVLLWLRMVDLDELWLAIQGVKVSTLVLALGFYMLAYFVRSIRWHQLMDRAKRPTLLKVWSYSLIGNMINYLIPIRAGEVAKAWLLRKQDKLPMSSSLSIIFIDKSFDTFGIFLALALLPFLALKLNAAMYILLGGLALVFVISVGLVLLAMFNPRKVILVLKKLFFWLPQRFHAKRDEFIRLFIGGMDLFRSQPLKLAGALGYTILGVILDGLYFWLIFRAFDLAYPFAMVLFGYTLINLSYALPQPPAQLGSNQWMMIIIFSLGFGLTKASASAVMTLAHVLTAVLISLSGGIALSITGSRILKKIFTGENLYD